MLQVFGLIIITQFILKYNRESIAEFEDDLKVLDV
jgi:hypothetical protein